MWQTPGGEFIIYEMSPETSTTVTWQAAINYCAGLGSHWKLPDLGELRAMKDQLGWNANTYYWSSIMFYLDGATAAWIFRPNDGGILSHYTNGSFFVRARCVRSIVQ